MGWCATATCRVLERVADAMRGMESIERVPEGGVGEAGKNLKAVVMVDGGA